MNPVFGALEGMPEGSSSREPAAAAGIMADRENCAGSNADGSMTSGSESESETSSIRAWWDIALNWAAHQQRARGQGTLRWVAILRCEPSHRKIFGSGIVSDTRAYLPEIAGLATTTASLWTHSIHS